MSVSSSCLVYSRLKPSLVSVLISVLISVSISVPISIRGQTRYGLGLISKKPSSFKKKPSFIQEKTEFFSSENRGQNKRQLGFLRWQLDELDFSQLKEYELHLLTKKLDACDSEVEEEFRVE